MDSEQGPYNACRYEHPEELEASQENSDNRIDLKVVTGPSPTSMPSSGITTAHSNTSNDKSIQSDVPNTDKILVMDSPQPQLLPMSPSISVRSEQASANNISTSGIRPQTIIVDNKRLSSPMPSPSLGPSQSAITNNSDENSLLMASKNDENPITSSEIFGMIDPLPAVEKSGARQSSSHSHDITTNHNWSYDWNKLPALGTSILKKGPNYNQVLVHKDGKKKELHYDPSYNQHLPEMHIFLNFNSDTSQGDALTYARERLTEYVRFVSDYLKVRKYAFECYPFNIQLASTIETELREYVSYNATHIYNEMGMVIQMWYYQAQKLLLQSNSLLFSTEVVQHLLKTKTSSRKHQQQINNQLAKDESSSVLSAKPDSFAHHRTGSKKTHHKLCTDIDILVIRPQLIVQIGWQLACDEPSLNIGDFPLDLSPWLHDEEDRKIISQTASSVPKESCYKLVSDESELEVLNDENAHSVLVDCMDRSYTLLQEQDKFEVDTNDKDSGLFNVEGEKQHDELPKLKKSTTKTNKKSGFVNFFKRKHTHEDSTDNLTSPTIATNKPDHAKAKLKDLSLGEPMVNLPSNLASPSLSIAPKSNKDNVNSLLNSTTWLVDYYSNLMNNYKKVTLPTQFIIPDEIQESVNTTNSSERPKSLQRKPSNALLYGKEYLQLRLPFKDNSLPAIYCPWVWSELPHSKWKALLREMYRTVTPGGYVMAVAADISMSNTFSVNDPELNESTFKTTIERDKTYDAVSLEAINRGLHIHTTKHLSKAFKESGFINIKSSILSLKTGDLDTQMGFLNEFLAIVHWDHMMRKVFPDASNPPKDTDPTTLPMRYFEEHLGKVDDNAGCYRMLFLVARKPKK